MMAGATVAVRGSLSRLEGELLHRLARVGSCSVLSATNAATSAAWAALLARGMVAYARSGTVYVLTPLGMQIVGQPAVAS